MTTQTTTKHFVVAFNPDRVLSTHSTYDSALEAWSNRGEKMDDEGVRSAEDPRWKHAPRMDGKAPYGFNYAQPKPHEVV